MKHRRRVIRAAARVRNCQPFAGTCDLPRAPSPRDVSSVSVPVRNAPRRVFPVKHHPQTTPPRHGSASVEQLPSPMLPGVPGPSCKRRISRPCGKGADELTSRELRPPRSVFTAVADGSCGVGSRDRPCTSASPSVFHVKHSSGRCTVPGAGRRSTGARHTILSVSSEQELDETWRFRRRTAAGFPGAGNGEAHPCCRFGRQVSRPAGAGASVSHETPTPRDPCRRPCPQLPTLCWTLTFGACTLSS